MTKRQIERIKNKYIEIYEEAYGAIDIEELPAKYRDFEGNFRRLSNPVIKANTNRHANGLDFGCGICGPTVLGHLLGIKITGIDIPESEGNPSPYVPLQNKLKTMGYPISIFDTTKYPWDFKDDQFDFIILYFSLNKEFMHSNLDFERRLEELLRVTKEDGSWYIWPTMHFNLMTRKHNDGTFDKDRKVRIVFGV